MQDNNDNQRQARPGWRNVFHFDALFVVFLLLGWSLIFVTATLALQRDNERWVPFSLILDAAADYSVDDIQNRSQLAPLNVQIIEAADEDDRIRQEIEANPPAILGVILPDVTPTVSPTPFPTPAPGDLMVSISGPSEAAEGSPVSLMATGFNSPLDIVPLGVTYLWDLDGDGLYDEAEGISTEVIFHDEGDYPVAVRASDLFGRVVAALTIVAVHNVPPVVELGSDRIAEEGQEVVFLANVSDPGHDILLYEWNFGDDSPLVSGTSQPRHIYQNNGEYTVRLRVNDNDGGQTEASLAVNVANLPPLADAGPDQIVDEGVIVTFHGSATDPADDPDTLTYAWDFDYDGETFRPDSFRQTTSTVYKDGPAEVVAALRVRDEDGGQDIALVKVQVNNVAPAITAITHKGPVGEGFPLNISVAAADVRSDPLTYIFKWDNNTFATIDPSVNITWYDEGEHTVEIQVDDGDDGQAFATTVVSTFNLTPTAVAQLLTSSPINEGSPVTFDGSESYDPAGNDIDPLTYQWDFGDGQTSSEPNPVHTYANNGQYNVSLTVIDDSGAADQSDPIPITILNVNPNVDAGSDRNLDEGVTVTFDGVATDPGSADILTYAWDFDYDGSNFNTDAIGKSVTWAYPDGLKEPESYVVALRVNDSDYPNPAGGGQSGEAIDTFEVTIHNLPPNADAGGPYFGDIDQPIKLTGTAQDVPADIPDLIYQWDLDNDGTFEVEGQTVTNLWNIRGNYEVRLRVTDKDGGRSTDTAVVNINTPPVAVITPSLTIALEGTPIVFRGRGSYDPDGDPLSYRWSFGDGDTASTISATHVYADNGLYTTVLTVIDNTGSVGTSAVSVTIHNANPVADAGPDQTTNEGVLLPLTGSATDPGSGDRLTYTWDFNYDGVFADPPDAIGKSVLWPAPDGLNPPQSYIVALRVLDDDYPYLDNGGEIGESTDTLVITVNNVAPIANAGGPYLGMEGQPVVLTGSAEDMADDALIYTWDLNYDGVNFNVDATGQSLTHIWNTRGIYTIALQVSDDDGGVSLPATALVDINANPINVNAGGPYNGNEGTPILFNGSATDPDGDPLTYTWDFGDGSQPVQGGPIISHTYADNGNYTVVLTVADGRGGTNSDSTSVTVNNTPPTAVATANPNPAAEGEAVAFDASGSSDPGILDNLTYVWDFGDGSTGSSLNPTHTYADNGNYTVTLTVRDKDGAIGTTTLPINVVNVAPAADAGGPYRTTTGVPIILTGSGSDVPADPLIYTWDFDYDGIFDNPPDATGQTVAGIWTTPGDQTVALRVTDDDGGFAIDTTNVDVGSPPVAKAGWPYAGNEGSEIIFNGSASTDPDGDPLTYTWDFGDGSQPVQGGPIISHTYADNGNYTVVLTVADGRGGTNSDSTSVTVNNTPPTAVATANPNPAAEGEAVAFDASGSSDPGILDNLTYVWDFGDGSTGSSLNPTHTYADNGNYTVTLTVRDKDGAIGTTTLPINVVNVAPTAVISANPNPAPEGTSVAFDAGGSTDPGSADTLTYSWDFGDGGTDSGPNPTHTYADNGNYTVTLTVTDKDQAIGTATLSIEVVNTPPTAVSAGGPYATTAGTPVQLTGSGSDVPADPLTYRWDLDNDGTFETNGQIVTFTQATTATYTVHLEVDDGDGGVTRDTTTVEVNSVLPLVWLGLLDFLRRRKRVLRRK